MWERADRSLKSAGVAALAVAALCLTGRAAAQAAADNDFMPHGYCYLWNPHIVWLNVVPDGLIALSYYCIPVVLIYFVRKRRDLPFNWIFWMFGSFILACGTTHLMEIWNVWHGSYLLSGIIKAVTAAISVATAVRLIPLLPQAVAVPNLMDLRERNLKLEREIAESKRLDPTEIPKLSRAALTMLVTVGPPGLLLFFAAHRNYPDLHTILDTCMFVLTALLASLFWDIGARGERPFPKWISVSFAVTSLTEFVHTLASLEQSGIFPAIPQAADIWRPASWPPAAYLLPIGMGCAIWLMGSAWQSVMPFALAMTILAIALFPLFRWLPRYASPTWLGITRPTLVFVPLLWGLVALACWRLRAADRVFPALGVMAVVLVLANVSMLYSR